MEITNLYNRPGITCIVKINSIDEMNILHRALRYLKILGGDKNGEDLDKMLNRLDKWHRVYNAKQYNKLLSFTNLKDL